MQKARKYSLILLLLGGIGAAVSIVALDVLAQGVPQPALTIRSLGSNQFSITITNGVADANYQLYWTPILSTNPIYQWQMLGIGDVGQWSTTIISGH